jgi:hypothetical protein
MADEKVKPVAGPTYIHGIGSSQAIDTAGEIVDLAGIDCSSLVGGAFNFEHKSDLPAQIVGKILEYKKIFSEKDCESDAHKYFWDKCKTPYLYVMGRLFDDKKDSSRELAALFIDDAEHPDEQPMIGLSIEGSKVEKKGIIVTKSIARKITCTNCAANKTCVAEIVKNPDAEKSSADTDSIFKSEPSHTIELFEPLTKREVPGSKIPSAHPPQGPSKAVKGAPGWSHTGGGNFSHPEHGVVSVVKEGSQFNVKHGGGLAGVNGKKGSFGTAQEAGAHAGNYIRSLGQGKIQAPAMHNRPSPSMDKSMMGGGMMGGGLPQESTDKKNKRGLFNPDVDKISNRGMMVGGTGMARSEKKTSLKKAMSAGSGMASPASLSGGAALAPESLDRKMKKAQWLARAEEAYKVWEKREAFEGFMAKHMPSLTKGEVSAIGQTLALRKSLRAEKKLAGMIDEGQDSWVKKSEKPQKIKPPGLKGIVESEVSHIEADPYLKGRETVHLKSGHKLEGHPIGKFKAGDKVVARQHLMGTHLLEHKK